MFRFSVRKNGKVRQVFRVGTVASLAFCLAVRAQANSRTRATQQEKGSKKPAETAPSAQTFTLVGAGDIATCKHLESAQAMAIAERSVISGIGARRLVLPAKATTVMIWALGTLWC